MSVPTFSSFLIAKRAYQLLAHSYDWYRDIRSITVRAINLTTSETPQQLDLLSNTQNIDKIERLELVVDKIRERYGKDIIKSAILFQDIGINLISPITMPTGLCR